MLKVSALVTSSLLILTALVWTAPPITPAGETLASCDTECILNDICNGHSAIAGTHDERDGGLHGECFAQSCCYAAGPQQSCKHPCCQCIEEEDQDIEQLMADVAAERWAAVARSIRSDRDRITVNADRSAIQVVSSCANQVVAHIPVSSRQIAYMTRFETRRFAIR